MVAVDQEKLAAIWKEIHQEMYPEQDKKGEDEITIKEYAELNDVTIRTAKTILDKAVLAGLVTKRKIRVLGSQAWVYKAQDKAAAASGNEAKLGQ